ncbi:hypothetical protein [Ekhidna sp.]|uniref:hypothetical protein n=1 Tax=Ekhidna sp. TaxID=2608089 RepID=UPI003B503BD2
MKILLVSILVSITSISFGQDLSSPEGLYQANYQYYGNWFKILIIYPNGNYEFVIRTDSGERPIEPDSGERPKWTLDSVNSEIHLHKTKEYEPEITSLTIDKTGNLIENNNKAWEKFVHFYPNGVIWKFMDNGYLTTYNQEGFPLTKQSVEKESGSETITFFSFSEQEKKEAKEFIDQEKTGGAYHYYYLYHIAMTDIFGKVRSISSTVNEKKTTKYFKRNGKKYRKPVE